MALIKCKECGHEVSDKASSCPNCGCPIERVETRQEVLYEEKPEKKKGWIWALIVALLCLIGGGGYYAYTKLVNGGNNKDAIVELTPEFVNAIQKYEKLGSFSEGLAAVMRDGKWGYINSKGEEVIPCQYSLCEAFNEGLAAVQKCSEEGYIDTEWGYIDTEGKEVIPLKIKAEAVGRFSEGLAFVFNDYASFSVIDKEGKTVFSGESDFSWYFGPVVTSEYLPVYNQGNICIPIGPDNFAVYDKQGNKTKEIDTEAAGELDKQEDKKPYTVFTKENGDNEDYQFYTVGLKDANGSEVIPAIYDAIGNFGAEENVDVPNGVVLVVLEEIGEDVLEGYGEGFDSPDTKRYYGYADLKGNDTFSKEIKEQCQKSKEKAIVQLATQKAEELQRLYKEGPDWLQGAWRLELTDDYGNHLGYMYEVFNHGNSKSYIGESLISEREYTVSDDMVMYDSGHYRLDNNRQIVIGANGQEMQKVSNDTSFIPRSSSSNSLNSTYNSNSSSSNELAKYDEEISQYYPIMEEAYQKFMRDVRSGGYTTITPPNSFYELSRACTSVGAAANEARKICRRNGDTVGEQKYERIWEREKRLYDSAYNILGDLH